MRQNPHVRICGGPGSATTLVYPTASHRRAVVYFCSAVLTGGYKIPSFRDNTLAYCSSTRTR